MYIVRRRSDTDRYSTSNSTTHLIYCNSHQDLVLKRSLILLSIYFNPKASGKDKNFELENRTQ